MLLYVIVAEVLASFISASKMIKGIQIRDHEIKILNFANNSSIFLRDIIRLIRRQMILKLSDDAILNYMN